MKSKKIIILVAVSVATVLILGFFAKQVMTPKEQWMRLTKGPIVEAVYGLGTVASNREFRLKLGISATILKIFVKEGDFVKKGTPLLKMSEQLPVTAPFDGTIVSLPFKENENVFPQVVILWMVDLTDLYVSMTIEQSAALLVRKNQKASLMFESQRNQKYEATVDAVVPKEGQFVVNLKVNSLPEGVLPGMTADTSVVVGQKDSAVIIPLKALQGFKVKFKESGTVQKKEVKLGIINDSLAELLEPKFPNPENIEVAVPQ